MYIHKSRCHVSLLHSLQHLASPDSSLCVPHLCFWHSLQKVTMPFFWSLKQSLCCFPVPTQQLLPSRSAPARAENGDWTHTSLDQWARRWPSGCRDASAGFGASLFTSTPPPPFETERLLQRDLSRCGRRCHLPHRSSLFLTTYISQPLTPSVLPLYLSRRERLTYALLPVIALSSFGIYELALLRAEKGEEIFLCRINLLLSLSFSFLKKKKNSGKIGQIKCGGAILDHHGIGCCSMSICSSLGS